MSRSTYKSWILTLLCLFTMEVDGRDFPEPEVKKIDEHIYALLGPIQHANSDNLGYMINSTILIGDKGVVLIGSGGTHEAGWHIKRNIKKITSKPIKHVINTHFHGDHYLGNSAFSEAKIISSEACREMILRTGEAWVNLMASLIGHSLPNTKPIPADITYAEGKTEVVLNGIRLMFWVPKSSHSPGDLMVFLPGEKVLVSGDILVNGLVPTMQDGNIKNWIETLEEIERTDIDISVPGHGALMTLAQVKLQRTDIQKFYKGVKASYLAGLDIDDIRNTLDLSEWEKLERTYVIGRNIQRAYLEIEQDNF